MIGCARVGLGLEPAVDSALRKLLAALPAATRLDAETVTATPLVDPAPRTARNPERAPNPEADDRQETTP